MYVIKKTRRRVTRSVTEGAPLEDIPLRLHDHEEDDDEEEEGEEEVEEEAVEEEEE